VTRAPGATLAVALAVTLAAAPAGAGVALENAWMRPAHAGQPQAQVFVDLRSAEPAKLVGASMKVAKRAELVLVPAPDADASTHRVVAEIPLAANVATRLALGGSHVRLVDMAQDVHPGERHVLELAFVDASGRRTTATVDVLVRGLTLRRPSSDDPAAPK
jgi:copper(I)-binding protein